MTTCTNCNDSKVEPTADGIPCHACCDTPSWVKSNLNSSTVQNNTAAAADVTNAVADGVSDYFLFSAIGDVASVVGSGIGTVAECAGDVVGGIAECAGEILGAAFD